MVSNDPRSNEATSAASAGKSALARLGWMVGGTLMMLIAWFIIISSPAWTFGVRDAVFWSGALLAMTLRYLDISRFDGQTSKGEPASMADFRRYAAILTVLACVGWTFAQSVHL